MWHGTTIKAGRREDLGVTVRSGWEANVARWLNYQGIEWEYEPTRFHFPIKRGTKSYAPDFWLPNYMGGKWLEVKGYLPQQDKTRMKRFKLHCPDEFTKLVVITGSAVTEASVFFEELGVPSMAYYRDLNKEFKLTLPHWDE